MYIYLICDPDNELGDDYTPTFYEKHATEPLRANLAVRP